MLILKTALLAAATCVLADTDAQRRTQSDHESFEIRGVDPACTFFFLSSSSLFLNSCISDVKVSYAFSGILFLLLGSIYKGAIFLDQ